jgi:hypothetical protein
MHEKKRSHFEGVLTPLDQVHWGLRPTRSLTRMDSKKNAMPSLQGKGQTARGSTNSRVQKADWCAATDASGGQATPLSLCGGAGPKRPEST